MQQVLSSDDHWQTGYPFLSAGGSCNETSDVGQFANFVKITNYSYIHVSSQTATLSST